MTSRAWVAIAAVPLLLTAFVTTSVASDPYWQQKRMRQEEAQSRLENERRWREHEEKVRRSMQELDRMNNNSSSQTYSLDCDPRFPNDPSCLIDKEPADDVRGTPPRPPAADPYASSPYNPTGSSRSRQRAPAGPDCEPTGLFGAPSQHCIDLSKPEPKKPPLYVGEGPCRYNKNVTTTIGRFKWYDSRPCLTYLKKAQYKECGSDYQGRDVNGRNVGLSREIHAEACVGRVHRRVTGQ